MSRKSLLSRFISTKKRVGEIVLQKMQASLILRMIAKRHFKDLFITEVKNGPTMWGEHSRIDVIAVKKSWAHPCITGYEIKISRGDFNRDEKWPGYLDMCHRLYFACLAGLIQPEELPKDVGLIWYNPVKMTIFTKRAASFRNIEIPGLMFYYLLIARTDSDRHPFFSSRREFLEAWVQDREERRMLGHYVSNKMSKKISDLNQQIRELKSEADKGKVSLSELEKVRAILNRRGLRTEYDWINELDHYLKVGMSPQLVQSVNIIDRELRKIKELRG